MDKPFTCSEKYPWTATQLVTWILLRYLLGPTATFRMCIENNAWARQVIPYSSIAVGVGAFIGEMEMFPRIWAEKFANIVFCPLPLKRAPMRGQEI